MDQVVAVTRVQGHCRTNGLHIDKVKIVAGVHQDLPGGGAYQYLIHAGVGVQLSISGMGALDGEVATA